VLKSEFKNKTFALQLLRISHQCFAAGESTRDGLVLLRKKRRQMRRVLRTELDSPLKMIQRLKSQRKTPSNQALTRLQALRKLLNTGPLLCLLPDW
jgi:hypothetical protein